MELACNCLISLIFVCALVSMLVHILLFIDVFSMAYSISLSYYSGDKISDYCDFNYYPGKNFFPCLTSETVFKRG